MMAHPCCWLWHFAARRLYAFDVHCNSYFPLFLQLYGAHELPKNAPLLSRMARLQE